MNGYTTEDLEALLEMLESDESDESDESYESDESDEMAEFLRRRRPSRRPPTTASGRNLSPARPTGTGYVTQAQLQTALARVGKQIETNSAAIKTVSTRVGTVAAEQTRQVTALRRETTERKRENQALRRDLRQTRELAAIMPLLSRPKSVQLTQPAGNLSTGTKVLVDSSDSMSLLLPFLLIGGLGSSSGGSGGGGSGSVSDGGGSGLDSNLLLPLLLLRS